MIFNHICLLSNKALSTARVVDTLNTRYARHEWAPCDLWYTACLCPPSLLHTPEYVCAMWSWCVRTIPAAMGCLFECLSMGALDFESEHLLFLRTLSMCCISIMTLCPVLEHKLLAVSSLDVMYIYRSTWVHCFTERFALPIVFLSLCRSTELIIKWARNGTELYSHLGIASVTHCPY